MNGSAMNEFDDLEEINLSAPVATQSHTIKAQKKVRKAGPPFSRLPKWRIELYHSRNKKNQTPITLKRKDD